MEAAFNTVPDPLDHDISSQVQRQLWQRVAGRLQRGDALITTNDFLNALEVEYQAITGDEVTTALRKTLTRAITSFNRANPGQYVAIGVLNSVRQAFETNCFRLDWDAGRIESYGPRSIARFKSRDLVQGMLRQIGIAPSVIDPDDCVRNALAVLSGHQPRTHKHDITEPLSPPVSRDDSAANDDEPLATAPAADVTDDTRAALQDGTISAGELEARQAEQKQAHDAIAKTEMARASERIDHYVQQGYLTTDEGETVRQLQNIDARVNEGDIDEAEASSMRNSLLTKELRTKLDRKLKGAVDHVVRFLQAFKAMTRISPSIDEGLRFLIHHKRILDPDHGSHERSLASQELLEDRDLLHQVIDIMERTDHEVRMISVCLPPYSFIVKRGNERIGNLTIEEDFIDDLRQLKPEEISDRLHAAEPEVRVRPAADMRCLVAILNHLIKPTPWRKEVRMLRVQDSLEQFYAGTDNMEEARKQAQNFLNRRLRRMFRDLTADEKAEIEQRGVQMLDGIEEKVLAERQAKTDALATETKQRGGGHDEGSDLSEDELKKGALIGRVEIRVAGQMRRVPRKIMLDPDDEDAYCLAQRDRDTGELNPILRRGAKRIVERGNDGLWRVQGG